MYYIDFPRVCRELFVEKTPLYVYSSKKVMNRTKNRGSLNNELSKSINNNSGI